MFNFDLMETAAIVKLEIQEVNKVKSLIKEAIVEMERNRIYQWDEVYPDEQTILEDIKTASMYGVFKNTELAGIIVLNHIQSPEYSTIQWELNDRTPLVMHRLCVHPKFQNQGIAKQLLNFASQFALANNYSSIRLDAFCANQFAVRLYENNGFTKKGMLTFRKGDFFCYEKIIG